MAAESTKKTVIVAVVLCFVCSVLVSSAAVYLKPLQAYNKALDKKKNILEAAGLNKPGVDIEATFKSFEARVVDMKTGQFAEGKVDLNTYDARKAAKDPGMNIKIPGEKDVASIRRIARYQVIYLVKEKDEAGEEKIKKLIMPVKGYGLWSTLYGYIALDVDLNTVRGLTFYEHAETPGLGGEVDNPRWKSQWNGKLVYEASGNIKLKVIKGKVDTSKPNAKYEVDGLAGATITANGVTDLVAFWFGPEGYANMISRLRTEWNAPLKAEAQTEGADQNTKKEEEDV